MALAKVYKPHLNTIFKQICTCKGNMGSSLINLGSTPLEFYMLRFRVALKFLSSQWKSGEILKGMIQDG